MPETDASEASGFEDREPATRRSDVNLTALARESEVLLARGDDPNDAQRLVETVRPPVPPTVFAVDERGRVMHPTTVRLAVSSEELAWFPLTAEAASIAAAMDGPAALDAVIERAGLRPAAAMEHVRALFELGVLIAE